MAFHTMADDEVLGNPVAHFFKSGNILRSENNINVESLRNLLPNTGPNNTKIEYDLWYSVGDKNKIKGFVYTDGMSSFMYLRPANSFHVKDIMNKASKHEVTQEGEYNFNLLKNACDDKYKLKRKNIPKHKFVIFLPGTNIFNKVVDMQKVERAVSQGAKLKLHPISANGLKSFLKRRVGEENIIDKKISGHDLLDNADIVGCCTNSEMGLAALFKGKSLYIFDKDDTIRTYKPIYDAIKVENGYSVKKLKSILSCPFSGLVPYNSDNPQKKIDSFFEYCSEFTNAS